MSTSSGAIRNPYQRMLLQKGSPIIGGGTMPITKEPEKDAKDTLGNSSEIVEESANGDYKPGITEEEKNDVDGTLDNLNTSLTGFKLEEKESGTIEKLSERARNILNEVFNSSNTNVVITSGLRSLEENTRIGGNPDSFHLKGDAMDLRPSPELDSYLTNPDTVSHLWSLGYEIVDERNKEGYDAHWHLEPHPGKKLKGGLLYKK